MSRHLLVAQPRGECRLITAKGLVSADHSPSEVRQLCQLITAHQLVEGRGLGGRGKGRG